MEMIYARLQACALIMLDGAVYFIIAMLGAFVKDIYDTCTGARPRIEIYRIFVATTLSTFLTFAARDYVNSENLLPLINFVLGVIGWELFSRISTIDGLLKTITGFRQFITSIISPGSSQRNQTAAKKLQDTANEISKINEQVEKVCNETKKEERE